MDELLKPVMSTKSRAKKPSQPIIVEVVSNTEIKDADGALETLRSSPDSSGIRAVLHFLAKDAGKSWDAKIVQITNILVSQTIPDWWEQLSDDPGLSKLKFCLTDHFREATALSSLVSRLKSVTTLYRSSSQANNGTSPIPLLKVLLEVLAETLSPEDIVLKVHQKCMSTGSHAHQAAVWKEFISLISSGRLIAAVAEAEDVLRNKTDFRGVSWLGRGKEFCKWLARNVAFALVQSSNADMAASVYLAPLIGKALMLGYQGAFVPCF
jgi:telomere length regulation protein